MLWKVFREALAVSKPMQGTARERAALCGFGSCLDARGEGAGRGARGAGGHLRRQQQAAALLRLGQHVSRLGLARGTASARDYLHARVLAVWSK